MKRKIIFPDETETENAERGNDKENGNAQANTGLSENAERPNTAEKNPVEEVDDLLNQYAEKLPDFEIPERKKRKKKLIEPSTPDEHSFVIPGRTFVVLSDMVVCSAFGFIDRMTNKNPIDIQLMRVQEQQIKDLEELGAAASKELFKGRSALEVFALSLLAIQFTNYFTLRQLEEIKNRQNKKPQ